MFVDVFLLFCDDGCFFFHEDSRQIMKEIIRAAATGSPSAVNQQAYKFYVVYNKSILHAIADKALAALVRQGFDIPACLCRLFSMFFSHSPINKRQVFIMCVDVGFQKQQSNSLQERKKWMSSFMTHQLLFL